MSNFGPSSGPPSPMRPPTMPLPTGRVIARYPTYPLAQRAVDFLSDNRLPVQAVSIVGTDLRVVERVTGRLSYGRVALQGALSGAWFGLLIGILLSLAGAAPDGGVATAMLFGSGFGLLFGVISYATTRGRRDFTSRSEIVAGEYQIVCADALVVQASQLLARLPSAGPPVDLPPPVVPRPPSGVPGDAVPPGPAGPAGPPVPPTYSMPPVPPTMPFPPGTQGGVPSGVGPVPPATPLVPWPPVHDGQPGQAGQPTQETPAPRPVGPTYSEMIEKQKRERLERERAEREAARKAAAERAAAAAAPAQAAEEASEESTDVASADATPEDAALAGDVPSAQEDERRS